MKEQNPEVAFEQYLDSCLPDESMQSVISDRMRYYARECMMAASLCALQGQAETIEEEFSQDHKTYFILESLACDDDAEWPVMVHMKTIFDGELTFHTYHRGPNPVEAIAFAIAAAYVDRIQHETPEG
jgi:hypothetical protein